MRLLLVLLSVAFLALQVAPAAAAVKLTRQQVETVCGKDIQSNGGHTGCVKQCGLDGKSYCDYNCHKGKCEGQLISKTTAGQEPAPWTGLPFDHFRQISSTPNKGSLAETCQKVEGTFILDGAGVYSCENANCDAKGGICEVRCDADTRRCFGAMPQSFAGAISLLEILQNGNAVLRDPGAQGTGKSLSGGDSTPPPSGPVPTPYPTPAFL